MKLKNVNRNNFMGTPCFLLVFMKRKFYARDNNEEYSFQEELPKRKDENRLSVERKIVIESFVISYSLNNLDAAPSLGVLLYTVSLNVHERLEKWKPRKERKKERRKEMKRRRKSEGAGPGVPQMITDVKWSPGHNLPQKI